MRNRSDKDRVKFLMSVLNDLRTDPGYPADIKKRLEENISEAINKYAKTRKVTRSVLVDIGFEVVYGVKM